MACLLVCIRLYVFAMFIICNAIICSVAVWNMGFVESAGLTHHISIYLISLGAFALLFITPIIFIDLVRQNAVTSHIWFECAWVGIFWVLELVGAALASSDMLNEICYSQVSQLVDGCISNRVLTAFTWICTSTLLVYLVALTGSAIFHHSVDKQVWHATARNFAWFSTRSSLRSYTGSPVVDKPQPPMMAAPKPRRPMRPMVTEPWVTYSPSATSPSVRRPPRVHEYNRPRHAYAPAVPTPAFSEALIYRRPEISDLSPMPSIYPQYMQSAMPLSARSPRFLPPARAEPSPSPLGNWPRRQNSAPHSRRKPSPPLPVPVHSMETHPPVVRRDTTRHPRGPRPVSHREAHRPPRLNLNNIDNVMR